MKRDLRAKQIIITVHVRLTITVVRYHKSRLTLGQIGGVV